MLCNLSINPVSKLSRLEDSLQFTVCVLYFVPKTHMFLESSTL